LINCNANKSVAPLQTHFHSRDWTSLHKFISPDILPPEYGGHKPEVDFRKNQQYLYDKEEKLMGKTYLKMYTILRILFPSGVPTKTLYTPLLFPIRAT